jgi:hypothetical protein
MNRARDDDDPFDSLRSVPIDDAAAIRALLVACAREGRMMSYSEALGALGHRFTRPKMRALCRTIGDIDEAARASGEPELAVLVVRESDRLPGRGWWVGRTRELGYAGEWTGPDAANLVREMQKLAFDYWGSEPAIG